MPNTIITREMLWEWDACYFDEYCRVCAEAFGDCECYSFDTALSYNDSPKVNALVPECGVPVNEITSLGIPWCDMCWVLECYSSNELERTVRITKLAIKELMERGYESSFAAGDEMSQIVYDVAVREDVIQPTTTEKKQ